MYIKEVEIENIRSIAKFKMTFDQPAGWHVLIGDNGSGKSTVVRAIALGLIGPDNAVALRLPLATWIRQNELEANILLKIELHDSYDSEVKKPLKNPFNTVIKILREVSVGFEVGKIKPDKNETETLYDFWSHKKEGWFSTAFGPFRRFTGGNKEWSKAYHADPRVAAHLSVFGEDVALTESLEWLSLMKFQSLESNALAEKTLGGLKRFINESGLLPHGTQLAEVSSVGVFFKDGNGVDIEVTQLSDGFRSLLSMIFELIRQMVNTYGETIVFENILKGKMFIDVPGVVIIDEVDAHLHPTWQTRIGQWFTQYFPKIQFIVTTHSPLVCRACDNGTIWQLAAPGSGNESKEIVGVDKDRLIYGNILDAYGTELFGQTPVRSSKSNEKLARLGRLNMLAALGKISSSEETERLQLQSILMTDDPTGL